MSAYRDIRDESQDMKMTMLAFSKIFKNSGWRTLLFWTLKIARNLSRNILKSIHITASFFLSTYFEALVIQFARQLWPNLSVYLEKQRERKINVSCFLIFLESTILLSWLITTSRKFNQHKLAPVPAQKITRNTVLNAKTEIWERHSIKIYKNSTTFF